MIKKTFYPKTKRVTSKKKVFITEKLDGSNLAFFKHKEELYVASRNYIFTLDEIINSSDKDEINGFLYKGLKSWLQENGTTLEESLQPNAVICGEWIGQGKIKYGNSDISSKFYMFAKANIDEDMKIKNIKYSQELFIYPFIEQKIPSYINIVPLVFEGNINVTIEFLDKLYDNYLRKINRPSEGFIVNINDNITKYVRHKNGQLTPHYEGK